MRSGRAVVVAVLQFCIRECWASAQCLRIVQNMGNFRVIEGGSRPLQETCMRIHTNRGEDLMSIAMRRLLLELFY